LTCVAARSVRLFRAGGVQVAEQAIFPQDSTDAHWWETEGKRSSFISTLTNYWVAPLRCNSQPGTLHAVAGEAQSSRSRSAVDETRSRRVVARCSSASRSPHWHALLHHRANGLCSTINNPSEHGVLMAATYCFLDLVAQVRPMAPGQGVRWALRSATHAVVQPTLAQTGAHLQRNTTPSWSLSVRDRKFCREWWIKRQAYGLWNASFVPLPRSVRILGSQFLLPQRTCRSSILRVCGGETARQRDCETLAWHGAGSLFLERGHCPLV